MPFERDGRRYTLVDTAGLRKRGKSHGAEVEKFSIVKTLQAIEASNVAVLVLDAVDGITEQDAHVAGYILERGRAVVVAVNKWDAADKSARDRIKAELRYKARLPGFRRHAVHLGEVGQGRERRAARGGRRLRGGDGQAVDAQADARADRGGRAPDAAAPRGYARPKMRYAHQGGSNPPRVIIHGNSLQHVPDTYKRYLEGWFRDEFKLEGTPLRIELRTGRNPYDENRKKRRCASARWGTASPRRACKRGGKSKK